MKYAPEDLNPWVKYFTFYIVFMKYEASYSSWNVMAHVDAREGKWKGNWRVELVASTLHTTSEHGVSSITTADAHTSAASSRLNWRPRRFTWARPFRRKTKSGFCGCAITFQLASTNPTNYTAKGHCASAVELAVALWVMLFCYLNSLPFFLPNWTERLTVKLIIDCYYLSKESRSLFTEKICIYRLVKRKGELTKYPWAMKA